MQRKMAFKVMTAQRKVRVPLVSGNSKVPGEKKPSENEGNRSVNAQASLLHLETGQV